MSIDLRTAVPADLDRLLPALDAQFVYGKGRQHSLRLRFPSVFCAANADHVFVCEEKGVLLSALAVKAFDWLADGRTWRGAMIGAVYTDPASRGAGHASRLLTWTADRLRERGVDFGVLWTAQTGFYERLGWSIADGGRLAECDTTCTSNPAPGDVLTQGADTVDTAKIERVRQRWIGARVPRSSVDYRHIPIPAEAVDAHVWRLNEPNAGYALVGHAGDTGYVYEMAGDPQSFSALWQAMQQRYRHLYINDCEGSASHDWLTRHAGITWQKKPLAMWRPLSARMQGQDFSHWYIPYFDRI